MTISFPVSSSNEKGIEQKCPDISLRCGPDGRGGSPASSALRPRPFHEDRHAHVQILGTQVRAVVAELTRISVPSNCLRTCRRQSSTVLNGCSGWASRSKLKSDGPQVRQSTPDFASWRAWVTAVSVSIWRQRMPWLFYHAAYSTRLSRPVMPYRALPPQLRLPRGG